MPVFDVVRFLHSNEALVPGPFGLIARVEVVGASDFGLREAIANALGGFPCDPGDPDGFLECFADLSWLDNHSGILLDLRALRMIDSEAQELLERMAEIAGRRTLRPRVRMVFGIERQYLVQGLRSTLS